MTKAVAMAKTTIAVTKTRVEIPLDSLINPILSHRSARDRPERRARRVRRSGNGRTPPRRGGLRPAGESGPHIQAVILEY